jgi:long-chain acyl-CoA synthetase
MLHTLVQNPPAEQHAISSLRYVCFGGGPMPVETLRRLIEGFPGVGFVHTYGQTEAAPRVTALLPQDRLGRLGSIGKPIPGVSVRLLSDDGKIAAPGEIGEIVVQGPNVMLGYYKRPADTAQVLRPDGLWTGDLARMDADGYLYLIGRRKNIVISGGINIYPEELEECLLGHPAVQEVVVMGEPHDVLGESPVAFVVRKPGTTASAEELLQHCATRLAQYKWPSRIEFRDSLSKTYNAKIKRHSGHAQSARPTGAATTPRSDHP